MGTALTVIVMYSLSVLIIRVATVSLQLTGLSAGVAKFQALSAFSGAGYTTNESELIVNFPKEGRIDEYEMYGKRDLSLIVDYERKRFPIDRNIIKENAPNSSKSFKIFAQELIDQMLEFERVSSLPLLFLNLWVLVFLHFLYLEIL